MWQSSVGLSILGNELKATPTVVKKYVERLHRDETLVLCSKLNLIVGDSLESPESAQLRAFNLLLTDGLIEPSDHKKIVSHLKSQLTEGEKVFAISRPALLEFMKQVALHSSNSFTQDLRGSKSLRRTFVRALLGSGDLYATREIDVERTSAGTLEERRFNFLPSLRRAVVWGHATVDPYL